MLLCIAGTACCVAMAMPQVHIVAYCTDLGYGAAQGAQMLSLMLACGVVSRIVFGFISALTPCVFPMVPITVAIFGATESPSRLRGAALSATFVLGLMHGFGFAATLHDLDLGRGALVVSEDVADHFAVGRAWLRRNLPPWAPSNATVGILEGAGAHLARLFQF